MTINEVCAVVITFHPDRDVLNNLAAVRPQVKHLVVVDNGSSADELSLLHDAGSSLSFELIENGENLGIATALNIGVRRASSLGAPWVLFFDQDSCVTDGFADTMVRCFETNPWGDRLGVLVPRYVDKRFGSALPGMPMQAGGLEAATTSGSLMRTRLFAEQGFFFLDELFIDAVDYEHSLRLRRAGYIIDECPTAVLLHSPGTPDFHRFLGKVLFRTSNYSPMRRYYQERNKIWVAKRYFFAFPVFCLKLFLFSSKDFVKILVAEGGNRNQKLRYFLRGVRDGLFDRMGRLEPRKAPTP